MVELEVIYTLKRSFTLSPTIMVQWTITLTERKLILEIHQFSTKNHDYGRKGIYSKVLICRRVSFLPNLNA